MRILGAKFFHHDSAVFLLDCENQEVFAMSTERVTRIKHDNIDISYVLKAYPDRFRDIDWVCHSFSDSDKAGNIYADLCRSNIFAIKHLRNYRDLVKPAYIKDLNIGRSQKFTKLMLSIFTRPYQVWLSLYYYCVSRAVSDRDTEKNKESVLNFIVDTLSECGIKSAEIDLLDHHLCHAVASYYFSEFVGEQALCLTLDGAGDGFFSKAFIVENGRFISVGESRNVRLLDDLSDHMTSVGGVYMRFTEAMDLHPGSDEGKVEARAAYGEPDPKLYKLLRKMTVIENDSIIFDTAIISKIYDGEYLRAERLRMGDESFCASAQKWLEDTVVDYLLVLSRKYPEVNKLALSGGVAANIIMSLNIYERTPFREIFVLPFMADDGASAGAAIIKAMELGQDVSWLKQIKMPYLGDCYDRNNILKALDECGDKIVYEDLGDNWQIQAADDLYQKKVLAFFQGAMEFGPRALGNRSIIANPTDPNTTDRINSTVKRRPWYQPFCPSILEEERERLFEDSFSHKHMAIAFRLKEEYRESLPCAVHVDGTARPQFISEEDNPAYWNFLKEVKSRTGYGVVINTSFNLHGRTIVRTPQDALRDYIDCGIDVMYIEGFRVGRD